MSALEKFSVQPLPGRHILRALPSGEIEQATPPSPLDALMRMAFRLLPDAVFVLSRGDGRLVQTWPPGVMGRRAALDTVAELLLRHVDGEKEQWVSSLASDPELFAIPAVQEAGPLAFASLPLGAPAIGTFAVLRHEGDWSEEDRRLLRDLAAAVAGDCERLRLTESAMEVEQLSARVQALVRDRDRHAQSLTTERITSVAPLLSGVCHELNNPLTSIQSFAELLLLDARSDDDREALEIVRREAHRAARIVGDLRLVARQSAEASMQRELVDLNELVRKVLQDRAADLEQEKVEVAATLSDELEPVRAVRPHLEQMISHLVSNALQALDSREGIRRIELSTTGNETGVRLSVRDSGRGITAEHLGRIFDPRGSEGSLAEGFNLGLSLAQSIVTSHGGRVAVHGRIDRGSVVTVDLPTGDDLPLELVASEEHAASEGLRVLVVDDEAPIRFSLARYMERRGHVVDQAADGAMALRMVESAAMERAYDIVIADLSMPELSGERLLARLKARDDGLDQRLIFMTGDARGSGVHPTLHDAGIPILLKPFELAEVAQVIEAHAKLVMV